MANYDTQLVRSVSERVSSYRLRYERYVASQGLFGTIADYERPAMALARVYNSGMQPVRRHVASRVSLVALTGALAGAVVSALPVSAQPRRRGEVVRVERARAATHNPVRLCPTPTGDGQAGSCYGSPPRRGDRAFLFDYDERYLGALVVESAESSTKNRCHHDTIFDFSYRVQLQGSTNQNVPFAVAVFGLDLDPRRARLMTSPPDAPDFQPERAKPWMGLDADGDGHADLVVTAYDCSDEETPPTASGGQTYETYCLDYWDRDGARWKKTHRDKFYTCG